MKIIKFGGEVALGILAGLVVLFALFYVLTIGEYTVPKTVAQDPSLPHITTCGVTYHAETFGDPSNPVVVTIHTTTEPDKVFSQEGIGKTAVTLRPFFLFTPFTRTFVNASGWLGN